MAKRPVVAPYSPKNPQKYKGTYPITLRSNWERSFAYFCDTQPDVINWSSEPVRIPYMRPGVGQSIYVPDFFVTMLGADRSVRQYLVEIKPKAQTFKEMASKDQNAQHTVAVNQAKWTAAVQWCARRNVTFTICTEDDLFNLAKGACRKTTKQNLHKSKLAKPKRRSTRTAKKTVKTAAKRPARTARPARPKRVARPKRRTR